MVVGVHVFDCSLPTWPASQRCPALKEKDFQNIGDAFDTCHAQAPSCSATAHHPFRAFPY